MNDFLTWVDRNVFGPGRSFFNWTSGNGWYDPRYGTGTPKYDTTIKPTSSVPLGTEASNNVVAENNTSAEKSADKANTQTDTWFFDAMKYNSAQAQLQRDYAQSSADKAMQFEAQEAEKLRQWLKMLSDTQYQRAVQDLRKAGINPILLAKGLSPASTPSGSSASGFASSGSSASISQSSAVKADVDLNSRARLIESYLRSNTDLKKTEIDSVTRLLTALLAIG